MKYIYLILGLISITTLSLFSFWYYVDFIDMFNYDRYTGTIIAYIFIFLYGLLMSFYFLYFGLNPKKINKIGNISTFILLSVLIFSFLWEILTSCNNFGDTCNRYISAPIYIQYALNYLMISLIVLANILNIKSFFMSRKSIF